MPIPKATVAITSTQKPGDLRNLRPRWRTATILTVLSKIVRQNWVRIRLASRQVCSPEREQLVCAPVRASWLIYLFFTQTHLHWFLTQTHPALFDVHVQAAQQLHVLPPPEQETPPPPSTGSMLAK